MVKSTVVLKPTVLLGVDSRCQPPTFLPLPAGDRRRVRVGDFGFEHILVTTDDRLSGALDS